MKESEKKKMRKHWRTLKKLSYKRKKKTKKNELRAIIRERKCEYQHMKCRFGASVHVLGYLFIYLFLYKPQSG